MFLGNIAQAEAMGNIVKKTSNVGKIAAEQLASPLGTYNAEYGQTAGTFEGKYDVSDLTYPLDLFGHRYEYGDNYVIFYINVAEDSKLITGRNQGGEAAETVEIAADERLRASINQTGVDPINTVSASTSLGAIAGGLLSGNLTGAAQGAVVGGVSSAVVSAAAGGQMSRQQKRLKSAIALHVPNSLSVRYAASYEETDTFAFQAAAQLSQGGMTAISDAINNDTINLKSVAQPVASTITNMALNAPGIGGALSAASGLAPNPKKEQVFKGVDFRTFTFDYQFAPKSEQELRNVMNIINTFKYHMHPEFKDKANFVFVYPAEFDIHYYHKDGENQFIHRHTSCVLKDLTINYTPNTSFNTFENGAPTQINIQMTFMELAILTKDQIKMGY